MWYEEFKIKQLGQEGYNRLMVRAKATIKRRDDSSDVMVIKEMIRDLEQERNIKVLV